MRWLVLSLGILAIIFGFLLILIGAIAALFTWAGFIPIGLGFWFIIGGIIAALVGFFL